MAPERDGENVWFTVQEAANVLSITRQAVYAAIQAGYLPAEDRGSGLRVNAADLIAYGIRRGDNALQLVNKVQAQSQADVKDALFWVLAGLGLLALVKGLLGGGGE